MKVARGTCSFAEFQEKVNKMAKVVEEFYLQHHVEECVDADSQERDADCCARRGEAVLTVLGLVRCVRCKLWGCVRGGAQRHMVSVPSRQLEYVDYSRLG
eukprot:154574-Pyramimonas_sp.AAC.1